MLPFSLLPFSCPESSSRYLPISRDAGNSFYTRPNSSVFFNNQTVKHLFSYEGTYLIYVYYCVYTYQFACVVYIFLFISLRNLQ